MHVVAVSRASRLLKKGAERGLFVVFMSNEARNGTGTEVGPPLKSSTDTRAREREDREISHFSPASRPLVLEKESSTSATVHDFYGRLRRKGKERQDLRFMAAQFI